MRGTLNDREIRSGLYAACPLSVRDNSGTRTSQMLFPRFSRTGRAPRLRLCQIDPVINP